MSRRNRQNGNQPAICEYDELIKAVWEDDFSRNKENIQHLVHRIREKIKTNSGEPEFLQTVNGRGYLIKLEVID